MESLILEDLKDLGRTISAQEFEEAIIGGAKSITYTKLVEWITKEIQTLSLLDEYVNSYTSEADSSSFLLEVSSFLKELGCSYSALTTGHVGDRLNSKENKLLLLDYLIGELRASRIIKTNSVSKKPNMQVALIESSPSKCLREILITLKYPKPPNDITTSVLFSKIVKKLQELLKTIPPELIGKPIVRNSFSSKQWEIINNEIELLNEDFTIRRTMLLTRLDVTVQSFQWPDRLKSKIDDLEKIYQSKLDLIKALPNFTISDVISAREDLAIVEKTSSTLAIQNTNSSVNKVIIGQVPDRGGRPKEQQAPPPEMPSWQQRSQSHNNRGGLPMRGGQERGRQQNRGGQGRGQQNRDNQYYGNSNIGGYRNGNGVYQVTDGFQSISVGARDSFQTSGSGRVQGGWNNKPRDNYQDNNYRGQSTYANQNVQQNTGYSNNSYQSSSASRGSSNQDYYNNDRNYNQNDSFDNSRRGFSKRGRGHDGRTYYNQQRNNQNY
ncbi:protein FAM98A [Adelges cooleyi]|uniref:protein FAM98A n=1 Tax=Adelges cooleyi TaxID=133065 RepID=UPI0021802FED|nr:protein FAM98A [Adelges cooleyi]XP_050425385.1 protein FAM98A [Adelges cooleyi]XP_050425387.1 protein FAM98A [Adelges cooleyi]XP_050425388.1 protein FAM98A [Adelges cooleyi]XP_050425389.1 protein FAM98A [Adelges cooleyi]